MAMTALASNGNLTGGGGGVSGAIRLVVGVPVAAVITALLFMLMRGLIFTDAVPNIEDAESLNIEIVSQREDSAITRRDRRPEQPREVRTPPPPPRIEAARARQPQEGLASVLGALPDINPERVDRGSFQVVITDRDEQPLVRLEPQYPRRAAERGLEGDCVVTFDVNPDGTTANIRASCSSDLFRSAATRAVERWRYQPRISEGQAVIRRNLQVEFPFRLTG